MSCKATAAACISPPALSTLVANGTVITPAPPPRAVGPLPAREQGGDAAAPGGPRRRAVADAQVPVRSRGCGRAAAAQQDRRGGNPHGAAPRCREPSPESGSRTPQRCAERIDSRRRFDGACDDVNQGSTRRAQAAGTGPLAPPRRFGRCATTALRARPPEVPSSAGPARPGYDSGTTRLRRPDSRGARPGRSLDRARSYANRFLIPGARSHRTGFGGSARAPLAWVWLPHP